MSSITIVGVGTMAGTLARLALAAGNAVEIVGRDRDKAEKVAATLDGATVGAAGDVPAGDIVVLAVPYDNAAAVVSEYGDALRGKIIVDITNPMSDDRTHLVTPDGSSGAQEIAKAATAGAHVVKAFNTLFANVLATGSAAGRRLDVFVAGDDAQAKARLSAFVESLGLRALDVGPLPMARALENVALLELGLAAHAVKHTDFALGISIFS